jgi:DNA-binding transcriptional MerR regulator
VRIGELAAAAGVSTAAIRFYERSGVLTAPRRDDSGYRDYPARALEELRFVRAGQAIGLTLVELAEITAFRDHGHAPCAELLALMERRLAEVEQRLTELAQLRADLTRLVAAAHALDFDECRPAVMYGLLAPPGGAAAKQRPAEATGAR